MDAQNVYIEAGELRHRVTVERQSTDVDYSGQPLLTWTTVIDEFPASIEPLTGKEGAEAKQMHAEATHRVITRHYAGFTTGMRILFGAREFNILEVQNIQERNRKLVIICREIVG